MCLVIRFLWWTLVYPIRFFCLHFTSRSLWNSLFYGNRTEWMKFALIERATKRHEKLCFSTSPTSVTKIKSNGVETYSPRSFEVKLRQHIRSEKKHFGFCVDRSIWKSIQICIFARQRLCAVVSIGELSCYKWHRFFHGISSVFQLQWKRPTKWNEEFVFFFRVPIFRQLEANRSERQGKKCSSFRLTILRMTSDRSVSIMRNNMCSIRIVWHYQRVRESELGQEEKKRHTHMNRASTL